MGDYEGGRARSLALRIINEQKGFIQEQAQEMDVNAELIKRELLVHLERHILNERKKPVDKRRNSKMNTTRVG